MSRSTEVALKTVSMILVFAISMVCCIYLFSFDRVGATETTNKFSSPEVKSADTPVSRDTLDKKFEKYNTETAENGKTVITLYDMETVQEIHARKKAGEWFYLTTDEMLYLVENTVELFKNYDIVRIYDEDGTLHSYYGLSFYSSEEYFACFGGFDFGINDISFDMKTDIYHTALMRASLLNCAIYDAYINGTGGYAQAMITDLKSPPSKSEQDALDFGVNPWSNDKTDQNGNPLSESSKKHYGVWIFDNLRIWFNGDVSKLSLGFNPLDAVMLYPTRFRFDTLGQYKYDQKGKTIVAEVYKTEGKELIARVRFDSQNDPEIIKKAEALQEQVFDNMDNVDTKFKPSNYFIVLYLNGFQSDITLMHSKYAYFADGDLIHYDLYENGLFSDYATVYADGSAFSAYMNEVIKEKLEN